MYRRGATWKKYLSYKRRPPRKRHVERCPWCGSTRYSISPKSNSTNLHDLMKCDRCHKDFLEGGPKIIWR